MKLIETLRIPLAAANNRPLLVFYCYYRLFLGLLFGVLFWLDITTRVLGADNPALFSAAINFYIGSGIIVLVFLWLRGLDNKPYQILSLLIFDFIALAIMIHASGGVGSGLAYLLLVSMAIGSLFTGLKTSIALAAFATILVMSITVLSVYRYGANSETIFSAGVLGLLLFVTAITFRLLAVRIQVSQQSALQQAQEAASLQRLAQQIVKKMRTGLVVLDESLNIALINESAKQLLSSDNSQQQLHEQLQSQFKQWQQKRLSLKSDTITDSQGLPLKINFSSLDDRLILFIEDPKQLIQQAQQLKLASLGRLTASIAHEIRNPLGAISHASQLLNESPASNPGDQRLMDIIENQTRRIDHIINNVLQLSRRKSSNVEVINLPAWLTAFREEYLRHKQGKIVVISTQEVVLAKIDLSHLEQIMNNLVDNGLRHGLKEDKYSVTIETGTHTVSGLPYINIIDEGQGIKSEQIEEIFEPFYTTEITGSGLGLYLCKELCEANQANISYIRTDQQKSCFQLQLSHHKRNI